MARKLVLHQTIVYSHTFQANSQHTIDSDPKAELCRQAALWAMHALRKAIRLAMHNHVLQVFHEESHSDCCKFVCPEHVFPDECMCLTALLSLITIGYSAAHREVHCTCHVPDQAAAFILFN